MTDESPEEKQHNEIEALQAIFGDDLKDLRGKSAWQVWKPLDLSLTLYPQQGSSGNQEVHCMIDLHIICPRDYPNIEPKMEVKNSKGLSNTQIQVLLKELEELSLSLKGEVMIFELAQHVQTFLHQNNKPGFKSFYDEMLNRQKQNEQMRLHEENKERKEMQDEVMKRTEILKMEMKRKKETKYSISSEIPDEEIVNLVNDRNTFMRKRQSTSECSDVGCYEHRGVKTINFSLKGERQITRGKCLGHSERGCIVYSGLDSATGELLAIIEWIIEIQSNREKESQSPQKQLPQTKRGNSPKHTSSSRCDLTSYMKQIASIEQELSFLTKLHHSNLVHYSNMKYSNEKNVITLYLLQEFIIGGNVSKLYLSDNIIMDAGAFRHFASGLLDAIDHLHRNNVVHKDIRSTNVFIDKMGTIRLADYSIDKRLMELYQGGDSNTRFSKKQDIFRIGVLFISLLKGKTVPENQIDVPLNVSQDLRDFLSRCTDKNERSRWSAEQLLKHQFIKTPIYRISSKTDVNHEDHTGSDAGQDDFQDAVDLDEFMPTSGQSRIKNEFEILKWLGKGAFGDVLKVKNKLDGGCYAIKRIELNPKNKQLNKKITREVKLLSRLNHENVVRYYNSWIESAVLERKLDDSSSTSLNTVTTTPTTTPTATPSKPAITKKISKYSFGFNEDIEKLAPPIQSVEWSVSYSSHSKQIQDPNKESYESDSSDSEDDDDDDDDFMNFLSGIQTSSNSDSIEFKGDDSTDKKDESEESLTHNNERDEQLNIQLENSVDVVQIQYMYIQMEFCEKSTLRNAIDNGFHSDPERMWRLFREVVEGLSHIHQQGMIHRDLKPVNIFLDLNDHVKIGDFGLATNILPVAQPIIEIRSPQDINLFHQGDISLTGHVGTALYVAPELMTTGNKAIYNQKVDMYSLGIILFEMSFMPLTTGMERVKILGNLRTKDIVLPESFNIPENSRQIFLIRWLLNHDGSSRPTCSELLQCEQLPSALEECEFKEVLRHALAYRSSKTYRHFITACFQQELTPAEDITYDMNLLKITGIHNKQSLIMTRVKEMVIKIFKLHGGVELITPLLLPLCHIYDSIESSVRVMTHSGDVVHIPHDLRIPFARYVARNGITMMKRYSIERVYREKKIFGFHPRELYECAFDIVTPTPGNYFAEAELLLIVYEILNEFSAMRDKNLTIHLNHTSLLKAILMTCGIEEEKYGDVYNILSDARDGKLSKFQIQTHLISLCLSDQAMITFFSLLETVCPIEKLAHTLKSLLKKRGEISILAREGFKVLESVVHNAEILGVKCPILISPCMVYNVHQYSGMICQFVCELKKKRRKGTWDVIAAGGRYDKMLNNFRKSLQRANLTGKSDVSPQAAAGISLSLERLVQVAMISNEDDSELIDVTSCDVWVCSTSSSKAATKEKAQIVSLLWNAGIKANLVETVNSDEIQDLCREFSVTHKIIVSDSEQGIVVRVVSWERDRLLEKKVSTNEILEYVQRLIKTWNDDADTNSYSNIPISRSESKINEIERQNMSFPNVSVNFITPEKLAANTRRRYENQILSQMANSLQKISPKNRVQVLAVSLDGTVLRTLTSYLEIDVQQNAHDQAVKTIIEKHPRNKKYIIEVCDEFRDLCLEKNRPIIALYSLQETIFKLFI